MSHEEQLGAYLKRARKTAGLTLRAVEGETGISNGTLANLRAARCGVHPRRTCTS